MTNVSVALSQLDALLSKCPGLKFITSGTNYNGNTKPFGLLCKEHADDKVKEAMGRRHYYWNEQKQCYHIDTALFFAIKTRLNFINENTVSFHGTPEAFNVGKKLLQKVFHNKMVKLGWEKNEEANCWNYVGIENTMISEETTVPDDVSAVSTSSVGYVHSTGSMSSAHSTGSVGSTTNNFWSKPLPVAPSLPVAVKSEDFTFSETRLFSSDPAIEMWQKRLYNAQDFFRELKSDPDFDEEASADAIRLGAKAIEKAKKKIAALKKAKSDEKAKKAFSWADDDSSDDEA